MHPLKPDETDLVGGWIIVDGRAIADDVEQRIAWLVASVLEQVAKTSDGWTALCRDHSDGRYWELTYPRSEMHGGGPSLLTCIDASAAKSKYQL